MEKPDSKKTEKRPTKKISIKIPPGYLSRDKMTRPPYPGI